ncbi:hypothetical protein MUU74_16260 [Chryseobacterium daecheongense]|uniref:hypothetical protein n=1 Tax=Chryseobacterium daecheongense TaxID=192389 RepID=UPI001FD68E0A|nr:hypothetical protein [Chryseobacterium daecheongense]UOU98035.1 hypothetical protein MUU74_16260 [Chryseobacterium daecheongense]
MKLYLDWNVLSSIKNGNLKELETIIRQPEKFVIVYSTAHISDISSSYSENNNNLDNIQSDLEFISEITDDLCIFNNGKDIVIQQNDPFHLFENEIESRNLLDGFSFDKVFDTLNDNGNNTKLIEPLKELLKSFPIDNIFKDAFENPQSADMMNAIFPGLKDNPTLEGFFNSMGKVLENINDKEGYKDLKKPFKYLNINQGKLTNPNNNPFDTIKDTYKKLDIESPLEKEYMDEKHAPKWFNDLCSAYINLDMHGFHSDDVKVTEKEKKTFKNTTQDSFHAAFASTCDIYITSDKKNYQKTRAIYNEKSILTHILKPDEFIQFYHENLEKIDFITSWNKLREVMQSGNFYDISDKNNPDDYYQVHFSRFYFFGYFNRIYIFNSDTDKNSLSLMFGKELPTNCLGVFYREIKEMVKIIVDYLGTDINGKGYFELSEIDETNNWCGRIWDFGEFQYRLVQYKRYFQFYYDFSTEVL